MKVRKLRRQDPPPREAVFVCWEAYQVVGSLLSDIGQFGTGVGEKILDNLSAARLVHKNVLPWDSFEPQLLAATRAAVLAERERCAQICDSMPRQVGDEGGQEDASAHQCADAIRAAS